MKFEILSIDVWGNAKDGFTINQSFHTGVFVEIPDNMSDKDAGKLIRKACGHRGDVRAYAIQADEFMVELSDKRTGKPCYLARAVQQ
jgi:hypothetical protein